MGARSSHATRCVSAWRVARRSTQTTIHVHRDASLRVRSLCSFHSSTRLSLSFPCIVDCLPTNCPRCPPLALLFVPSVGAHRETNGKFIGEILLPLRLIGRYDRDKRLLFEIKLN